MRQICLTVAAIVLLAGCSRHGAGNSTDANLQTSTVTGSLLSNLRPHADPAMVEQIRQEEAAKHSAEAKQAAEAWKAQQAQSGLGSMPNLTNSMLPNVSQAPFAPPAEQAAAEQPQSQPEQNNSQSQNNPFASFWPFG